jgi:hypothetical protein
MMNRSSCMRVADTGNNIRTSLPISNNKSVELIFPKVQTGSDEEKSRRLRMTR